MNQQQTENQEEQQSGTKIALGILGFIAGLIGILYLAKMLLLRYRQWTADHHDSYDWS